MNPHKAQLKILLTNELGADIEDSAEAHERDQYRCEGGAQAARKVYDAIKVLQQHVDKDLDEGKFSEFPEPLVTAKLVKSWIARSMEAANGIHTQMEAQKIHAQGRAAGVRAILDVVKKQRDNEQRKLDALIAAAEEMQAEGDDGDARRRHIDQNAAAADLEARKSKAPKKATTKKRSARKVGKRADAENA